MDPERWQRIERSVAAVIDAEPSARRAVLAATCGDDATLRREVERLLDADRRADGYLSTPAAELMALDGAAHEDAPIPERIGPYRVERALDGGGMGQVVTAWRDDDVFERRVAVKCIRRRIDSEEARAWFRAERQILARLEHPNIARLYDGGTTDDGMPYLAMEYIDGLPLDRHCAEHGLSIDQRIELFLGICDAVHYAHQNLLIHRDLKPSNILVDHQGVPKLLDFGIAKQLASHELDPSLGPGATTTSRPLTPGYTSPEQIRGEPVTTATDVHGLGTLLYELLTGRRLYASADRLPYEMERAICEREPLPPSQAVALDADTVVGPDGEQRSLRPPASPDVLRRRLAGDLDAIASKALEKRPADRYPSCLELADDLRRFFDGQPVEARASTVGYRLRKAVHRHATAIGLGLGISTILLASAGALWHQAERLRGERQAVLLERQRAEQVSGFLIDMVGQSDPDQAQGEPLTAVEVLERSRQTVDRLADQPRLHAMLLEHLGSVYVSLGRPDLADEHLVEALAVNRRLGDIAETADVLETLASARSDQADFGAALHLAREALALRRQHAGERAPSTLRAMRTLATIHLVRGENADAKTWLLRGLELSRQRIDGPTFDAAEILHQLGSIASRERDLELAEMYLLQARKLIRLTEGDSHPDLATTDNDLGVVRALAGRPSEAVVAFRRALDLRRRVLDENHPRILKTSANLASLLVETGRAEEAEPLLRDVLARRLAHFGADHPQVLHSHLVLGHALLELDRLDEAEASLRAAERIAATLPEGHYGRSFPALGLGRALTDRRPAEAERWFRQALAIRLATWPDDHVLVADAKMYLGLHQMRHGRHREARELLIAAERGLAGTAKTAEHRRTLEALEILKDRIGGH